MKKTFKLVLIFGGCLVAVIVCALTGYFLIANNKTFYIYDVRLVEPNEGMAGYIYTDEEAEYTSIRNKVVYMNNKESSLCQIAVYASASSNAKDVKITSSDPNIARILYQDNKCYVQYLKEGLVTITSELYGVKDSFSIQIYDKIPSDFAVFDEAYYGEYADLFPNDIVCYADEKEYKYHFYLNNSTEDGGSSDGTLVKVGESTFSKGSFDSELIEIGESTFQNGTFESVSISTETNELVVKCRKPVLQQTEDTTDYIVIRPFFYDEEGSKVYSKPFLIEVYVVSYIPEFLQIEISSTPNFDEGVVFTDTVVDANFKNNNSRDDIKNDKSLLKSYLSAKKAENYLAQNTLNNKNGEKATYNAFLTDRVKRLYLRMRMVYSNGDIVYLKNNDNAAINIDNNSLCYLDPTEDYYIMTLTEDNYFDSPSKTSFNINISLNGFDKNHTFAFVYRKSIADNKRDFYDEKDGIYTYKYWDKRARFVNEIYDENGNVIGFCE